MINIILIGTCVFCLVICISICGGYLTERNTFRDKWIRVTEEYKDFIRNTNYDLEDEIAELKDQLKENNNA